MDIICLPEDLNLKALSHELRTPLVPILGFAYQLLDTELTPEQESCINDILHAGNQLLDLANKLAKTKHWTTKPSLTEHELHLLFSFAL